MSDYTLSEHDRAEAIRLNRKVDLATRERDLYLQRKADELKVPWSTPLYDQDSGSFSNAKAQNVAVQPLSRPGTPPNPSRTKKRPPGGA